MRRQAYGRGVPHGYADGRMRAAPVMLGVTLLPLGPATESLSIAASLGVRGVQLDASDASMRPRDLDAGARRDVGVMLRRLGLVASGIDCFVPVERFADASLAERAVDAVTGSLVLAEALGRVPVCLWLPRPDDGGIRQAILGEADRRGVPVADFNAASRDLAHLSIGVDPAMELAEGRDPVAVVHALGSRVAAARVVDLLRSGMRGPIGEPGDARLGAAAWRLALELAGFTGLPVIDARQWAEPLQGIRASIDRWTSLLPVTGVAP